MCGIKIVLVFGVLLATSYARPEGYSVKGTKPFRETANAAASGHVYGNTGPDDSGLARSFASASAAVEDASAGNNTANAVAQATSAANVFTDGKDIEKAISMSASAIANANHPIIGESDILDRSNNRKRDPQYKAANHQDGTPACDQHIANAPHSRLVNNENSTPRNIGSTNSATVCHPGDSKCRNTKNDHSLSIPYPTYNDEDHPDLSAGSSQPLPNLDGGYGGSVMSVEPTGEKDYSSGGHRVVPVEKNPDISTGSTYPSQKFSDGCGDNSATSRSKPCTPGSSGTSNPFLNGEIDVSEIQKAVKSGGSSPESSGTKPKPPNPFLSSHNSRQYPSISSGDTDYFANPKGKPNSPSNPSLNISHDEDAPTDNTHSSVNPNTTSYQGGRRPYGKNPENKPNPSLNPSLNPHNQHSSTSTVGTQNLENQNTGDEAGPFKQYPHKHQLSPSNPIPTHRERDHFEACSRASCKHKDSNGENDNKNRDADDIASNRRTSGRPIDGVKTYRSDVKGDSPRKPQTLPPISYDGVSDHGDEASADADASWNGYNKTHAIASASASGNGSAHAKSQTDSRANSSGWSNSWASSSASASAYAYSSSWH